MSQKQKIFTVVKGPERTGDGGRLLKLLRRMLAENYEVHYLAAKELRIEAHPALHSHIVPYPFKKHDGIVFWFCFFVLAVPYAVLLCLAHRFCGILTFGTTYSIFCLPASLLTLTPLNVVLRSVPWKRPSFIERTWVGKAIRFARDMLALQFARRILAASYTVADSLHAVFPLWKSRVVVIPFAVAPIDEQVAGNTREHRRSALRRKFCEQFDIPPKALLLVTAGVLQEGKNIEPLIRAIAATESDNIFLVICGDGEERGRLESIAYGLGIANQIEFARWSLRLEEVFPASDIFVLPSKDLVVSNSIFESLDAGVPVLAADTAAVREVVKYDQLLFDPDDVHELAATLREFGERGERFEQLQEFSFRRARELSFDWEAEVLSIIDKKTAAMARKESLPR